MAKNDISELGKATRFSSENQPANPGRKKNKFKHLRDQFELSAQDVNSIIEYQMSLNTDELHEKIISNPESTVLEKAFAKAILEATKKGDLSQIEKLLDRKIGKVPSKLEADVQSGGKPLPITININPIESGKE